MQVYAVTVYVEGEKAARELGVRQRGGFFDDNRCRTALLNALKLLANTESSLVPSYLGLGSPYSCPEAHVPLNMRAASAQVRRAVYADMRVYFGWQEHSFWR